MKITTKCICCGKSYNTDTQKDKVWKLEYCSKRCMKKYYTKTHIGFVPQGTLRPLTLPEINMKHFLKLTE